MPYKDKARQAEYQAQWMAARREDEIRARGHRCQKCGETKGPFEFDHVDRSAKVEHRVWSWSRERRDAELEKCQMLCHSCHAIKTGEERGWGSWKHGTITGYKGYKCRCGDCRKWNREYEKQRRARA